MITCEIYTVLWIPPCVYSTFRVAKRLAKWACRPGAISLLLTVAALVTILQVLVIHVSMKGPNTVVSCGHVNENSAPDIRYFPPVWISGLPRSGATLLYTMLNMHPQINSTSQSHVLSQATKRFKETDRTAGELRSLTETKYDFKTINNILRTYVLDPPHVRHYDLDKVTCVNDQEAINNMDAILEILPKSKFIYMVRDGRDLAWPAQPSEKNAKMLKNFARDLKAWDKEVMLKYAACTMDQYQCLVVKYEDLALNPCSTIGKILNFVGLQWHENVMDHHLAFGEQTQETHGL